MKRLSLLKILLLCLVSPTLSEQSFYFERRFDIPVSDTAGNRIKEPWFGGLNAVIIGEIDLNFDGKMDLVVYDQHAERIFTFLNMGPDKNGFNKYVYAPEFERYFPRIAPGLSNRLMWFQLVDFNGDGLPDLIMSDGLGGVRIYKNVSQKPNIRFELYIERMFAEIDLFPPLPPISLPLSFSTLSRPHFVDVDGDGDLDMLVFGGMGGTTLYFYKNRSVENFGRTDTFDFVLADRMWGCFREGNASNEIILNTCSDHNQQSNNEHTLSELEARYIPIVPLHGEGSTIFAFRFSNDSVYDLLLADGGYPTITALFNEGTPTDARIGRYDTLLPGGSTPVRIFNTPTVSTIHLDNTGEKSLLFSPFNARDFSTDGYASIWVYRNMSTSGNANFQLINKRFLQEDMLDFGVGAFPTFVDIDGNGLFDIVIGNHGVVDSSWHTLVDGWVSRFVADLVLLRNIGTDTMPAFQVYPLTLTPPLNVAGAVPTFGYLNNDGYLDLLIGTECGKILHYRNKYRTSAGVFPPHFVLVDSNILEENIGAFLAPQLFDFNGDGLLDLVVGSRSTIWFDEAGDRYFKSSITYFQNTGTRENPIFTFVTDSLGRVDVTNRNWSNEGHGTPHFFRDVHGNTHLFSGNKDGKVLHFTDIDGNLDGTFQRMDDIRFLLNDRVQALCEGSFTSVAVADLNGDGILDMVVGNHRGGLTIFFGISELPPSTNINRPVETQCIASLQIYPNPVQDRLFVKIEENYRMRGEILDLQGRIVRRLQTIQPGLGIDVSWLPAGVYILRIHTENQVFTQKFIKN
ncbi:MAG: T9SS type A sorting domain-containing protein [Bacteroidales bacterium]|nr:T9SS type A sorting domain-containing protein [Bacteroidales bacterium]